MTGEEYEALIFSACEEYFLGLAHSDDLFTYYAQEDLAGRSDLVLARLAVKTDCYLCLSALVEALSAEANHDEMAATEITPEQEEEISRGYI